MAEAPLALVLLWANESAQAAGCETWWLASAAASQAEAMTASQIRSMLSELRKTNPEPNQP